MTTESLESTKEVKKYLKRLLTVLRTDAVFSFLKTKLYNKSRIDDILCCVEASFPDEYKKLIKSMQARDLKSYKYYVQLSNELRKKFFLCESLYQINYRAVEALVNGINAAIDSDMKYIKNSTSGMY